MNNWQQGVVGDLAHGVRGVSYRPEHLLSSYAPEAVVLLRSTNIQGGSISFESLQFVPSFLVSNEQRVNQHDIVVCMSNGSKTLVGKSAPCKTQFRDLLTVGAFCSVFHPHAGVHPSFVAHVFNGDGFRRNIDVTLAGSAINNLRNCDIERFFCLIPDQNEQSRIAAVLDTVDEAIVQTEKVIAKLRQVRTGLLHDLLTCGLDENGQLRDPVAHPEQFQDTPLGLIPKAWKIASLVSQISFPEGQVDPRIDPYCSWTLIAPDHVESGTGTLLARVTALQQGAISGKYMCEPDDVIYSKIRPYLRKAVLATERGLCSADMYPLRPNEGIDSRFLLAVVLSEAFTRFASAVSMRSGFPKINRDEMAGFATGWPDSGEQNRIADMLAAADAETSECAKELAKLQQLKSGLMDDLLTGRVRVPEGVCCGG